MNHTTKHHKRSRRETDASNETPTVFDIPEMGGAPLEATLIESRLVYYFAKLREIVRTHEATLNDEKERNKTALVRFDEPALVVTQASADKPYPSTYLNNPVTFDAIRLFLYKNKAYIRQDEITDYPEFVPDGSNTTEAAMVHILDYVDSDIEFIDFDDRLAKEGLRTELIFCILVNKTHQRISLVFRGTVNYKDILVDANFFRSSHELIEAVTGNGAKVHSGFKDYLLKETKIGGGSQFQNICDVLKELYANPAYRHYKLSISGHSLGGALAQLASFLMAGSKDLHNVVPSPVTAITYASPVVGDQRFFAAYRQLETKGRLRHIRISNSQDVITGDPTPTRQYVQTGVNLHLHENGPANVSYFDSTWSCLRLLSIDPASHHSIYEEGGYFERLYKKNADGGFVNHRLLKTTTEELYQEHAGLLGTNENDTDASKGIGALLMQG